MFIRDCSGTIYFVTSLSLVFPGQRLDRRTIAGNPNIELRAAVSDGTVFVLKEFFDTMQGKAEAENHLNEIWGNLKTQSVYAFEVTDDGQIKDAK